MAEIHGEHPEQLTHTRTENERTAWQSRRARLGLFAGLVALIAALLILIPPPLSGYGFVLVLFASAAVVLQPRIKLGKLLKAISLPHWLLARRNVLASVLGLTAFAEGATLISCAFAESSAPSLLPVANEPALVRIREGLAFVFKNQVLIGAIWE